MKTLVQVVLYGFLAVLVVGIIAVIYKYTNGFNEDFKTFYVEYNGEKILTEKTTLELDPKKQNVFAVKYTFDKEEDSRGYSIKIVPNVTTDFEFTVDDKKYMYSKAKELTEAFKIVKDETSFEIEVDENNNVHDVLKRVYGGEVKVSKAQAESNGYPYMLIISSYNGKINYNIAFKIKGVFGIYEDIVYDEPEPTPFEPDDPNPDPSVVSRVEIPWEIVFTGGN